MHNNTLIVINIVTHRENAAGALYIVSGRESSDGTGKS